MKEISVYSHDICGPGNIRRMLAVVEHRVADDPEVCALVATAQQ